MKRLIILTVLLTLTSCSLVGSAAREEMGKTGEPPVAAVNQYRATMTMICNVPILRNVNTIITNIAQGFFPTWVSTCEMHEADDS